MARRIDWQITSTGICIGCKHRNPGHTDEGGHLCVNCALDEPQRSEEIARWDAQNDEDGPFLYEEGRCDECHRRADSFGPARNMSGIEGMVCDRCWPPYSFA